MKLIFIIHGLVDGTMSSGFNVNNSWYIITNERRYKDSLRFFFLDGIMRMTKYKLLIKKL